jgi:integrase
MRVKFYLTRPDADAETAIFARVSYAGRQMKVYTGISVLPKHWNKKLHKARQGPSYRPGSSINTRLDKIAVEIESLYYDHLKRHGVEPSHAELGKQIDAALGKSSKGVIADLLGYFEDFIRRTDEGQRRDAKGRIIKPSKAYKVTLNNLRAFNGRLDFDTIDLDFYHDYLAYLQKKGLSENTIGRDIKNLKAVLNEATENGVNSNLAFRSKRFTKPSEDVESIALSADELRELKELDLPPLSYLDRVRDLFLIGCYTGLRYSDFSRLTADNVKGNFIEIKQQKTGASVAIPVHPIVAQILDKYDGELPEPISNQKTNDYLKEVCQRVPSLCAVVSKTGTKGGVKMTVSYQKWQIITSHTARRSFATNAYLQGVPTITIMAITGHKTEKAFLKYIKVTSKEHAKIMADHWAKQKMKIV